MAKPTRLRCILAHGFELCTRGAALLLSCGVFWSLRPNASLLEDASALFFFASAVAVALPFGWVMGLLLIWPFVSYAADKMSGAPFHVGEQVQVLAGPHRGRVARVYESWPSRGQVRLELGEREKEKVEDAFSNYELWRLPED